MIAKLFTSILFVSVSVSVFASEGGHGVGNGGGAWTCRETAAPHELRWVRLVDLFEGENSKNYVYASEKGRDAQIEDSLSFLENHFPKFGPSVRKRLDFIRTHYRKKFTKLEQVDDALFRIRPDATVCKDGVIEYVQLANYHSDGTIEIREDWLRNPKLSSVDQAALFLHEAIYAQLRSEIPKDPNSVRTRFIVGILFSDLSEKRKAGMIRYYLGPSADLEGFLDHPRDRIGRSDWTSLELPILRDAITFFRSFYSLLPSVSSKQASAQEKGGVYL